MTIAHQANKSNVSRLGLFAVLLLVAVVLLTIATLNGSPRRNQEPLIIEGVWARPGLAGGNTAVYMTLTNKGREPLRLVAATTEVADAVELHETVITPEFVMQMRPVERVELPAASTVEFRSGGLHVMLFGLKRALNEGDEFELELVVEGLEPLSLKVPVRLSGDGLDDHHHAAHDAGHAHEEHAANDEHAAHERDETHAEHEAGHEEHETHDEREAHDAHGAHDALAAGAGAAAGVRSGHAGH